MSLKLTGLDRFFGDDVFSSQQVLRGKPAPDLFLFAAERMNTAPEHAVVIEDSIYGVQGARAAGMRAVVFWVAATSSPATATAWPRVAPRRRRSRGTPSGNAFSERRGIRLQPRSAGAGTGPAWVVNSRCPGARAMAAPRSTPNIRTKLVRRLRHGLVDAMRLRRTLDARNRVAQAALTRATIYLTQ